MLMCTNVFAAGFLPAQVSSFTMGNIEEDYRNHFKVTELANVIVPGKSRTFETFLQVIPVKGTHEFSLVIYSDSNHILAHVGDNKLVVTDSNYVHSFFTTWTMDVPTQLNCVYFMVVDKFGGKVYDVNTFKFLVEQ